MNPQDCRPGGMIAVNNPKSPLEQSVIMIDAATDMLSNGLNEFYSRLETVLAQIPPNKSQPSPSPVQPGCSIVVEKLHQITQRIEFMNEALAEIRRRLEV